jgi:hypothetical protein
MPIDRDRLRGSFWHLRETFRIAGTADDIHPIATSPTLRRSPPKKHSDTKTGQTCLLAL